MNKDILNALASALLGTGSAQPPESVQKWYVCISDGKGGYNRHETASLLQAQATIRDWNASGWSAWLQDADGNLMTIAEKPREKN